MISVSEALKLILSHRADLASQSASLEDALGARCAAPIKARLTMPPNDASAMDGYAVRFKDAGLGANLKVVGEAPAGASSKERLGAGEAVRIFTGGPVPHGADHIVIQENVDARGDHICVTEASPAPRHIRRAGIDFQQGETLIKAGVVLQPAHIALAASANHAALTVYRRPKVAIIANGNELRAPGSELASGQIISSNSAGLSALIRYWGGEPVDMGIAADNLESIKDLIRRAKDADIIVPVGGASVGDYDFMKQAFEDLGYEPIFSKIAVKPGKPTWFGTLGEQRVLGLPGNPASANVCAHLFLKPLVGFSQSIDLKPARVSENMPANGPRETYLRGRLSISDGQLTAHPFARQDSSLITPLAQSNALLRLPPKGGPWDAGDRIEVLPLGMGPDIL